MALNEELLRFIREALGRGLSREKISKALTEAGWGEDQIKSGLAAFAPVEFPLPVPRPNPYLSAREAFMYLLLFTTLYICSYNVGSVIFQLINRAFPDPAAGTYYLEHSREVIRWSVSALIIAFPVFLYVSWLLSRAIRRDPSKRGSKVRKWLTYITLFNAAGTIIGDLTTLVYNFLGGELTTRFLLKVLTVGLIAGAVFGYYLWELRQEEREVQP